MWGLYCNSSGDAVSNVQCPKPATSITNLVLLSEVESGSCIIDDGIIGQVHSIASIVVL